MSVRRTVVTRTTVVPEVESTEVLPVPSGYTVTVLTMPAASWHSQDVPPVGTAFGWKSHKGLDDATYQQLKVANNWSDAQRLTETEWDDAVAAVGP
jgi:hypothetical protein